MRNDLSDQAPKRRRLDATSPNASTYHLSHPNASQPANVSATGSALPRHLRPPQPRTHASHRGPLPKPPWQSTANGRSSHNSRHHGAGSGGAQASSATPASQVQPQGPNQSNPLFPPINLPSLPSFPAPLPPVASLSQPPIPPSQLFSIDPSLRNLPRPFPQGVPVTASSRAAGSTTANNPSRSIHPQTNPIGLRASANKNRYHAGTTSNSQMNKNHTGSGTLNGHTTASQHATALRTITPVAEAIALIPDNSPIISALARVIDPMCAPLPSATQRQTILNFTGFPLSSNPTFQALLELHKNELDILAWVFAVSKHGRKDEVARRICSSLRAPLKWRTPSSRRPNIPQRTMPRTANPTSFTANSSTPQSYRGMNATVARNTQVQRGPRGSMPSLAPSAGGSSDHLMQHLERHLQPGTSPRNSSVLSHMNGTIGQGRHSAAQNRGKQVRDLCHEVLQGYTFKAPENPFNEPMNPPLGERNYVIFSAVQLSRGNSDPVLLFPTPAPIDPKTRPEVCGGQVQIHLRCLRVEVEKPRTDWKQAWPFPASCRVNGHLVQLNQAQRYTNGKLAGLDTATDITPYLRKFKSSMSESNRVTLRRQSSTATPASGQFVMFAQEILVISRETMTKSVQEASEKYWIEYRKGLERKGQISPSASRFEMARHGVVLFLTDPDGLTVSSMKVSLRCPLALTRIETPVKGKKCQHVQCFDLVNFLEYTRRSSKFECPVCNKNTAFPSMLVISPYIEYALEKYVDCDEVEIFQDGSMVAVERQQTGIASDDEDEDGSRAPTNGGGQGNSKPAAEVVDLTLDSDDDDDDDVPLLPPQRTNSHIPVSVASLLQDSGRMQTHTANPQVVSNFHTQQADQVPASLPSARNELSQLDQDIDFTFRSDFVPWADAGTDDLGIPSSVRVTTQGGNGGNWPGPVDVIAIDSD